MQGLPQALHGHDRHLHALNQETLAGMDLRHLQRPDSPQRHQRHAVEQGIGLPVPNGMAYSAPHPRSLRTGEFTLGNVVEADETYICGKQFRYVDLIAVNGKSAQVIPA